MEKKISLVMDGVVSMWVVRVLFVDNRPRMSSVGLSCPNKVGQCEVGWGFVLDN